MYIVKVGLNHQTAPLYVREQMSFADESLDQAMLELGRQQGIVENVILSTCNRTEIFALVEQEHIGIATVQQFLMNWFQLPKDEVLPFLHAVTDNDAIDHLFKLAVGMDSMVLGETQILGQVRNAFLRAQALQTTGKIFNELFKRVITFAKRAHRDTAVSEQAVSISYVAVELAKKIFGDIHDKHVVILGAGEMGELALKNLQGSGVSKITVVNRTMERAEKMAAQFNAEAVHMAQLLHVLKDADILISSTGSDVPVLDKASLKPIQKERKGNPLFLIDIAVPRDIDGDVAELDSVFLYDIDDLHGVVDRNLEARRKAADVIEGQLVDELVAFHNWVAMLDAVPVIQSLREKSLSIQERTLKSIHRKMPDLTEREMKVLRKHTKSIIHQLLEEPIKHAKQLGENGQAESDLQQFREIFGLGKSMYSEPEMAVNKQRKISKQYS